MLSPPRYAYAPPSSVQTAKYLNRVHGCTAFAVATLEEAITLRKGGIAYPPCRVLVLGAPVNYPKR